MDDKTLQSLKRAVAEGKADVKRWRRAELEGRLKPKAKPADKLEELAKSQDDAVDDVKLPGMEEERSDLDTLRDQEDPNRELAEQTIKENQDEIDSLGSGDGEPELSSEDRSILIKIRGGASKR